jgi:hypothetical protein
MGTCGELLGLSGLLMRGHGTPTPHHMWPYLDSLVVLSELRTCNSDNLLNIAVIQITYRYLLKRATAEAAALFKQSSLVIH